MSTILQEPPIEAEAYPPMLVRMRPAIDMSDDQLFEFAGLNRDLRIERTSDGELIIMPPCGGGTSDRNAELTMQLRSWSKADGRGTAFDATCGFILPNRAMVSPDAAWVAHARLNDLTEDQREKFLPLCPEFVVELRSRTDRLRALLEKMQEYMENGAQLGWLIDLFERRVHVYLPNQEPQVLESPASVSGEGPVTGFKFDLRPIL
jgi:Uma2 family endonuclease